MAEARIKLPATTTSFEVKTKYAPDEDEFREALADEDVYLNNGTSAPLKDAVYEWFCENAVFEDILLDPYEPDDISCSDW